MKPTLLVLAAGMGSRYGSLKQVDPVGPSGETILEYSVYDAIRAGFGKVVFVIRRETEKDFNDIFINKLQNHIDIDYVFQEIDMIPQGIAVPENRVKPWGTGHAVLVAASKVKEPFAAINADDYYGLDAFMKIGEYLSKLDVSETAYAMVGFDVDNTLSENGTVARGVCEVSANMLLKSVVERFNIKNTDKGVVCTDENDKSLSIDNKAIVSMNFWGFTPKLFHQLEVLFPQFINDNYTNPKSEFFLPSVVDKLIKSNQGTVNVLRSADKWFGVTYKDDKPLVIARIKQLVDSGVYPQNLWK